mmetsp:Transcript_9155/g.24125  ORF Transcript_9155/g.24125 Transcript_9155/m.24125 type:complete len:494 (-) Transcript_9155:306-1787(-)
MPPPPPPAPRESSYDYDLFVVGAGSGGVRAARIAAKHGARVAVAEFQALGGTCVNVGCVPKKLFVLGSHHRHDAEYARSFGWTDASAGEPHWPTLIENKNREIERLNGVYNKMLVNAGVEILRGRAKLLDAHTVQVHNVEDNSTSKHTADKILIAVGGTPFVPPSVEGRELVITSNDAFYLPQLPKRIVIVGGGYIAIEFACIFAGYGSNVTLAYRGELFLRGFDTDVREFLADQMREVAHVDVRFHTNVTRIREQEDKRRTVTLQLDKDGEESKEEEMNDVDVVMYATGRHPLVEGLGLEEVGVKQGKKGKVVVDEYSCSSVPNIFAVGDVTDRVALTPVALAEGQAFADNEFGEKARNDPSARRTIDYENIPTAVFSQPPIGTCGLTQDAAEERFGRDKVDTYVSSFRPLKHTLTGSAEKSFLKFVVHSETDKVLGCHMAEPAGPEMAQLVGVAIKAGATKADFDATIGVHPTSAEELVTMRTKVDKDSSK